MTEMHDALESCLDAIERGASMDHALERYPQLAPELRPLLEAARMAMNASRVHVPLDVRQRGRAALLRRVQEQDRSIPVARPRTIGPLSRFAISAALVIVLVLTSTGLVSASSGSLPGQQLYPVKRSWESLRLLLVFSPEQRDVLESGFEQERLDEISELLGRRMTAPISFSGILVQRLDGQWLVSGIPVAVNGSTALPAAAITSGAPITVTGVTGADGIVAAHQIDVLQPGSALPPFEPSESDEHQVKGSAENGASPAAAGTAPTQGALPPTPAGTEAAQVSYQFSGVVQSIQGNVWKINGQPVYVDAAQISGKVGVGSIVRFSGYYGGDGKFMVTNIEPQSSGGGSKSGGGGAGSPSSSPDGSGGSDDGPEGP